jgi:hypothetical protein
VNRVNTVGLEHLLNDFKAIREPRSSIFVFLHEHERFVALADLHSPPFFVLQVLLIVLSCLDEVDHAIDDELEGLVNDFVVVDLLREGVEARE